MAAAYRFPLSATTVEVPGISAARNAILDEARRRGVDFIAMIDDDETASTGWLSNLLTMQRETSAEVVGGPIEFVFTTPPHRSVIDSRAFRTRGRPAGETSPFWGSGNFLISTRSLTQVDWPKFDDEFGLSGGEDREWFMRLAHLGFRYFWAPDAITFETVPPDRATGRWILQRAFRCGNCNMRVAVKHWPSRELLSELTRIAMVGGSAPILAPLLFVPKLRLWLLKFWWNAAGGMAWIIGRDVHEYAERHEGRAKAR
jgi:GT2 family glycosyltransferase